MTLLKFAVRAVVGLAVAVTLAATCAEPAAAFYWPAKIGWPPKPTIPQSTSVAVDPSHLDPQASGYPSYWSHVDLQGVQVHGNATYYGSSSGTAAMGTIVPTPTGKGYWVVEATGGNVQSYGDAWKAPSFTTTGYSKYVSTVPLSDAAATPDGKGLIAVDNNGHVWTLGTGRSFGDAAQGPGCQRGDGIAAVAIRLNKDATGYWILGALGEVWVRGGNVAVYGDGCATGQQAAFTSMAIAPDGHGYWLVDYRGHIYAHGSAGTVQTTNGSPTSPVVYLAALPDSGLLAAHQNGVVDWLQPTPPGTDPRHWLCTLPVIGQWLCSRRQGTQLPQQQHVIGQAPLMERSTP